MENKVQVEQMMVLIGWKGQKEQGNWMLKSLQERKGNAFVEPCVQEGIVYAESTDDKENVDCHVLKETLSTSQHAPFHLPSSPLFNLMSKKSFRVIQKITMGLKRTMRVECF